MTRHPTPDPQRPRHRARRRLHRQFDRLRRALPWFDKWIRHLQADHSALIRLPIALVLIAGGFLGFLPILGFWMLPLGLMFLAIDIPLLQEPVASLVVRARRRISLIRRRIKTLRRRAVRWRNR